MKFAVWKITSDEKRKKNWISISLADKKKLLYYFFSIWMHAIVPANCKRIFRRIFFPVHATCPSISRGTKNEERRQWTNKKKIWHIITYQIHFIVINMSFTAKSWIPSGQCICISLCVCVRCTSVCVCVIFDSNKMVLELMKIKFHYWFSVDAIRFCIQIFSQQYFVQ